MLGEEGFCCEYGEEVQPLENDFEWHPCEDFPHMWCNDCNYTRAIEQLWTMDEDDESIRFRFSITHTVRCGHCGGGRLSYLCEPGVNIGSEI